MPPGEPRAEVSLMRCSVVVCALALAGLVSEAAAESQPKPPDDAASASLLGHEREPKRDLNEEEEEDRDGKNGKSTLRFAGRVFTGLSTTRQSLAGMTFWRSKQSVGSARVGVRYTHKSGARAVIKVEFEDDDPELKDGYIRLSPHDTLRIQAGRFKRPISAIGLASRWDLPTVERGLLDELRVEGQDLPFVGGRGVGVTTRYAPKGVGNLKATLGVFQNSLGKGSSSLDSSEHFAQDVYLRVALKPIRDLELASNAAFFGYLKQTGQPDSFSHAPVGSVDVAYTPSKLRLWVEGYAGTNMLAQVDGSTSGTFWGARALVAANLRTGTPRRLQPFAGVSYFDPRQSASGDSNSEVQGGASFAFTKIWRLQVEVAHTFAHGDAASATAGTAFHIQLGARLKD